jgi:hypothetical protein
MQLTMDEWNLLVDKKEIEDISSELPNSFLMIYQVMRAKIIWQGKKWYASAWKPPEAKEPFVQLIEVDK